jgi:putative redox protein
MDAKVTWHGGMSFTGTASSGFEINLGADPSVGGNNDGFRPIELFAVGLVGCTAMDVISILRKKRQEVTAFEVRTHIDRAADHPKVFTNITIDYIFTGRDLDRKAIERAVELSEDKYCSAQAMLRETAEITSNITINEAAS